MLLKFYFNNAIIIILKYVPLYTWEYVHIHIYMCDSF